MRGIVVIPFVCLGLAARLALAAPSAPAAPPVVPDTLARRLAPCLACHGDGKGMAPATSGERRYYPRIAGKPAGYLFNQLENFRAGRRQVPLMTWMVAPLSEAYLREIAAWFAAQPAHPADAGAAPANAAYPAGQLARGRQLATRGDPAVGVPACMACHGDRLTGALPAVPGLVGLPRDYVNAQFGAWRNGTRRARAPDCMGRIAARLTPADVAAVSAWLAGQAPPQDARPAPDVARPLPLACGSIPGGA